MAIALTPTNAAQLFSMISPFMLGFFIFMVSIFNHNIKGIIYLAGICLAGIINAFLMGAVNEPMSDDLSKSKACGLLSNHWPFYGTPSPSGTFIAFTCAYLILPLYFNNLMNYPLVISLLALLIIDIIAKVYNECTSYIGAALGALVGFLLGAAWYSMFKAAGLESLVYFNELTSNKVMCSKPTNQTFKCDVYKGGQLLTRTTV